MKLNIYTDGGARGNPGPAGIGVVVKNSKNEIIHEYSGYIGEDTNNVAEYKALIKGLEICKEKNGSEITCYLDSELLYNQLIGNFKVKKPHLRILWTQAKILENNFSKIEYVQVRRDKNKEADKLVNQVLDNY